jgi:hypothetical protein
MNLQGEMNKPIALKAGGGTMTLREFVEIRRGVPTHFSMARALESKHIALANLKVESYGVDQGRQLAIERLRASLAEKFEFLDGSVYSAAQAIEEIQQGSAAGKYFMELEKRAAAIAIKAVEEGKV